MASTALAKWPASGTSLSLALVLCLLCTLLAPLHAAPEQYCMDGVYVWNPDGTSVPQKGGDWSSVGPTASFAMGPCFGISGIGVTQTFRKTVVVIDRSNAETGYLYLANWPAERAYAAEVNLSTGEQRPLDTLTNTFCSSGQHAPDGTLVSIGGDWTSKPNYVTDGEFSIRTFKPCKGGGRCGFQVVAQLAKSRWYPTTALLGTGHVIIVGGSNTGVGLTTPDANQPSIEYYPQKPGAGGSFDVPLLTEALPYNLFPFVHVLPSGKVFLFASHMWTLWDTRANEEIKGIYPPLAGVDAKGNALRFSYPTAATSAMFPLTSANQYSAEIMICGGTATNAIQWGGKGVNGTPTTVENTTYPASNKCFRIQPEAPAPEWLPEAMQLPRVMPMAVLLPDGHVAVLCGAQRGHSGLGQLAHKPALLPEMYQSKTHTWLKGPLPYSKIPRTYHASAFLVHDGTIFISGSNPNTNIQLGGVEFPTEFRTEYFRPPYMSKGQKRPHVVSTPKKVQYGAAFKIVFKYKGAIKNLEVVAAHPGFSTHSGNHGMRNVVLDAVGPVTVAKGTVHTVTVTVPKNRNLLPPTWYWVFVVVNGVPNREGHYTFVKGGGKRKVAMPLAPASEAPAPGNN